MRNLMKLFWYKLLMLAARKLSDLARLRAVREMQQPRVGKVGQVWRWTGAGGGTFKPLRFCDGSRTIEIWEGDREYDDGTVTRIKQAIGENRCGRHTGYELISAVTPAPRTEGRLETLADVARAGFRALSTSPRVQPAPSPSTATEPTLDSPRVDHTEHGVSFVGGLLSERAAQKQAAAPSTATGEEAGKTLVCGKVFAAADGNTFVCSEEHGHTGLCTGSEPALKHVPAPEAAGFEVSEAMVQRCCNARRLERSRLYDEQRKPTENGYIDIDAGAMRAALKVAAAEWSPVLAAAQKRADAAEQLCDTARVYMRNWNRRLREALTKPTDSVDDEAANLDAAVNAACCDLATARREAEEARAELKRVKSDLSSCEQAYRDRDYEARNYLQERNAARAEVERVTNGANRLETEMQGAIDKLRDELAESEMHRKAEIETLKDVLHRDRTGLAAALNAVREEARGGTWIGEGRGSYEWDDARYQKETGQLLRRIIDACDKGLRESGNLAHAHCCARQPDGEKCRTLADGPSESKLAARPAPISGDRDALVGEVALAIFNADRERLGHYEYTDEQLIGETRKNFRLFAAAALAAVEKRIGAGMGARRLLT